MEHPSRTLVNLRMHCDLRPSTGKSLRVRQRFLRHCSPHHFSAPPWMPVPSPPESGYVMEMTPVSEEELAGVLKKSRSSSALSPFDRISYAILKRCPSLHPALLDLFNRVIMEGSVPTSWKSAVVKLIPKAPAQEDPSSLANFCPIALTPTISKLLSGIGGRDT